MRNQTAEKIYDRLRQLHNVVGGASSSQYAIDFERPGVVLAKSKILNASSTLKSPEEPAKSKVLVRPPQGELDFG